MIESPAMTGQLRIESSISDAAFARIAKIAEREAGIVLSPSKVSMVRSRLTRRLRALKIERFQDYLDYLDGPAKDIEMENFISSLTTNVSHFFRENHHFDYLTNTVFPHLEKKLAAGGKARIWSAGCSNGQEPYSIAMTLMENFPSLAKKDFKILATDIDPEVIAHARAGQYVGSLTTGLTDTTVAKYFRQTEDETGTVLTINDALKDLVAFRQLNLHSDWPMKGKFDLIFCRNVVIYFNEVTQTKLYHRFHDILETGGWLMLGHSERLNDQVTPLFQSAGVTTYRSKNKAELPNYTHASSKDAHSNAFKGSV